MPPCRPFKPLPIQPLHWQHGNKRWLSTKNNLIKTRSVSIRADGPLKQYCCGTNKKGLVLVSSPARWSFSFILGPLHWSSIYISNIQRTQKYSAVIYLVGARKRFVFEALCLTTGRARHYLFKIRRTLTAAVVILAVTMCDERGSARSLSFPVCHTVCQLCRFTPC